MSILECATSLVEARKTINDQSQVVIDAMTNKMFPLDVRWQAYEMLVNGDVLNKHSYYGDGFIDILGNNLSLYDDFYISKYENITYISMLEKIKEADTDDLIEARENNLDAWKEKVLASGFASFTYDW